MGPIPPAQAAARRRGRRRWRDSLAARATLFLVVGAGALLGGIATLSLVMVEDSVDRLLVERTELARTIGGLVEQHVLHAIGHIARAVSPGVLAHDPDATRTALGREYRTTIFREGAFALDSEGRVLAEQPDKRRINGGALDLAALVREVRAGGRPVSSPLTHLGPGRPGVVVLVAPVRDERGAIKGFVGGLLAPATDNLLSGLEPPGGASAEGGGEAEELGKRLDVVDANGVVIASTAPGRLFGHADHEDVLAEAIRDQRSFKGRCHSCHEAPGGEAETRSDDVLSFAPLSKLALGVAVHEPERHALAPAFELRRHLFVIVGIVFLFVAFVAFAVQSVVRPVVRLTRAVDALEATSDETSLPSFGRDEVGALARAVERWRRRVRDALAEAEAHRGMLHEEVERTRKHLEALEEIASQGTLGVDVTQVISAGLRKALELSGMQGGAIRLHWGDETFDARVALDAGEAECLIDLCGAISMDDSQQEWKQTGRGRCAVKTIDASRGDSKMCAPRFTTVIASVLVAPDGHWLRIALYAEDACVGTEDRWLHSLLYHVCMSATTRILRDREAHRRQLQERYLRGVLKAQEDERARIARDIHDTVAQDLAALRLQAERLGARFPEGDGRDAIRALEEQTRVILTTIREVLLDLRLTVLEDMGLISTLAWSLERLRELHGIQGAFEVDGEERELPYSLSVPLYRIYQECLRNIVQHADASHVFVTLGFEDDAVTLVVEDDGRGFDAAGRALRRDGSGLGMLGMEERARLLGGHLEITSSPDEGTTVSARLPLTPTPGLPIGPALPDHRGAAPEQAGTPSQLGTPSAPEPTEVS